MSWHLRWNLFEVSLVPSSLSVGPQPDCDSGPGGERGFGAAGTPSPAVRWCVCVTDHRSAIPACDYCGKGLEGDGSVRGNEAFWGQSQADPLHVCDCAHAHPCCWWAVVECSRTLRVRTRGNHRQSWYHDCCYCSCSDHWDYYYDCCCCCCYASDYHWH